MQVARKEDVKLNPAGLSPAEYKSNRWMAVVPRYTTRDHLTDPNYWSHVAVKLKPRDTILVFAEDDSFFAEYLVYTAERTWARVVELRWHELAMTPVTKDQAMEVMKDYDVRWSGPAKRFRVIRKSDNATMIDNLHTAQDGQEWLAKHLSTKIG